MKKLIKYFRNARAARMMLRNPREAGFEALRGIVEGYLLILGGWLLVILGILALFAFTTLASGPFLIAQILFWIVVGVALILFIALFFLWRFAKKKAHQLENWVRRKTF